MNKKLVTLGTIPKGVHETARSPRKAQLMSYASAKAFNEGFMNQIRSGEGAGGVIKQAADSASEFTRIYMREESVCEKVLPSEPIGNSDLDRQVDTDKPVKIIDKEPNAGPAVSVPFGQLPFNRYLRGPRYRVLFERIMGPRNTKDVEELRTYDMDLRQVTADNNIKDMAAEKDGKFFGVIDVAVGTMLYAAVTGSDSATGADRTHFTTTQSGQARYYNLIDTNGITRETLVEMLKIMPAAPSRLEVQTIVCNNLTIKEVLKFGRDEMGGDLSEEIIVNGWSERTFLGCRWIITIKRDLVANGVFYLFTEPKFLGKHFMLEDTTMWMKKEAFMLEWYCYQTSGLSIGNLNGIAKCLITRS